jgi:segregation and condensation protein B
MLSDDALKAIIEGILYVAPEPVTLEVLYKCLDGEEHDRVRGKLYELINDYARPEHGIQIRSVAGGYKFSSKPEHHEALRQFVKTLKPAVRLSRPALETLAVIAYRQPVTVPEINEIRGVDCGGVIHTLLEKKLVVTSGRKNVVGRPILYRTSREFLVHFGLRDVGELPSLREFEEMARQALGSEISLFTAEEARAPSESGATPPAALEASSTDADSAPTASEPSDEAASEPESEPEIGPEPPGE